VSRYYDSLLSKVIASAPTFDKAVQRMARALQEFQVSAQPALLPSAGHAFGAACDTQLASKAVLP
jgi:biotin carboxylase